MKFSEEGFHISKWSFWLLLAWPFWFAVMLADKSLSWRKYLLTLGIWLSYTGLS